MRRGVLLVSLRNLLWFLMALSIGFTEGHRWITYALLAAALVVGLYASRRGRLEGSDPSSDVPG
jgi:hypothetical protein